MSAETVLLVDHHQGKVIEFDTVLDQRMRADEDVVLGGRRAGARIVSRPRLCRGRSARRRAGLPLQPAA